MKKKISIKTVTQKKEQKESAENWVQSRELTKRLTFDAPASLHACLKIASAKTGRKMGEIALEAIESYLEKNLN